MPPIPRARGSVDLTKARFDRVILGGRVVDPESKLDAVRNIGIRDGRIADITTEPLEGADSIDARGLVVAPGFIDLHSHGTVDETYRMQSLDGVTTTLELELGTSDVAGWYRARSAGERINYGVSIGHIKVRMSVMKDSSDWFPLDAGAYGVASPAQVREMIHCIKLGLKDGAICIGAGFQYTPAATRDERLEIFRVAAQTKTSVHVHIVPGVEGLEDVLSLAKETGAPLQVVHLNSSALSQTPAMLEMIQAARSEGHDVTAEAYPYAAGMTEIQSATIQDVYKNAPDAKLADIEWPRTGERLNRESFDRYSASGGPIVVHTNTEPMVAAAIASPLTMIASDAYWQNGTGHPRTAGTFSRVLGRYVRETRSLSLMEAIEKMTLRPAQRLEARVPAMRNKGRLRKGADADITIFDSAKVLDRATYREPSLPPIGIEHVIVNGVSVVTNGTAVEGVTPGMAVRAPTISSL
ncbi:MAG TPA: amidohydrolase family protein [Gemmatimonadaceae bacterium]